MTPEIVRVAFRAEKRAPSVITGVQYVALISALSELNDSLITHLENGSYFSAESLSRVAIEHAINLMYILDEDKRADSLIVHYFDTAHDKAKKWLRLSQSTDDDVSKAFAQAKLDSIMWFRENCVRNEHKAQFEWPNAFRRFQAVGLEELYRTVYAAASDSVHSLSEDIFNLTLAQRLPRELKKLHLEGYWIEKGAFAVYLVATAMSCYCEAAIRLARKVSAEKARRMLQSTGGVLKEICAKHNESVDEYWLEQGEAQVSNE